MDDQDHDEGAGSQCGDGFTADHAARGHALELAVRGREGHAPKDVLEAARAYHAFLTGSETPQ